MAGILYGVGLGPGDPELITRKAARVLTEVDRIYAPAGQGGSFARRIVAPLNLPPERFRTVSLCMSRNRGRDTQTYDAVADEIAGFLEQGRSAAWISEGDPLFYSTFVHVYTAMRRLHSEVAIEIIPGVPSTMAAAARAGLPIAHLDQAVAVVSAAYGLETLPALLELFATVFLLKVHTVFEELLDRLASCPAQIQALYVENLGTPAERIITELESLRGQELPYFSLVILQDHSFSPEPTATAAAAGRAPSPLAPG